MRGWHASHRNKTVSGVGNGAVRLPECASGPKGRCRRPRLRLTQRLRHTRLLTHRRVLINHCSSAAPWGSGGACVSASPGTGTTTCYLWAGALCLFGPLHTYDIVRGFISRRLFFIQLLGRRLHHKVDGVQFSPNPLHLTPPPTPQGVLKTVTVSGQPLTLGTTPLRSTRRDRHPETPLPFPSLGSPVSPTMKSDVSL